MVVIAAVSPGTPEADTIVRAYITDVASRYWGRPALPVEVDQALADEPYSDLAGRTGVLLVASEAGESIACAGARFAGGITELTKVYTLPAFRGRGIGRDLIAQIETITRNLGFALIRLDTRSDLVEACALYERLGFKRVLAFNDEPYSDRWYAKTLAS